jgi:DNA transformation protein
MIRHLRNLGPQSEAMLAKAGIFTVEQLRSIGSVPAFLAVKHAGGKPSCNLLWAIKGALTGSPCSGS